MTRLTGLPRETLLRLALKLDAAVTGVNGVAYLVAAEPLEDALGVAASLLRPAGAFLVAFAVAVWLVDARASASRAAVAAVIAANAAWALARSSCWPSTPSRRRRSAPSGWRCRRSWWRASPRFNARPARCSSPRPARGSSPRPSRPQERDSPRPREARRGSCGDEWL